MPQVLMIPFDGEAELVEFHSEANPEFDSGWLGYKVYLTSDEVRQLTAGATTVAGLIPDKRVAAVVATVVGILDAIDKLGGRKGVTVMGLWLGSAKITVPGKR